MSVQYVFSLGGRERVDSWIEDIARECAMRYNERGVYPGGVFPTMEAEGITATAMPQTLLGGEIIRETYGFATSVCIRCTVDKFELHQAGMNRLLRLCAILAARLSCDFVLVINGETGWLLRKSGLLFLDERDDYWRKQWADMLGEFGLTFTLTDLDN